MGIRAPHRRLATGPRWRRTSALLLAGVGLAGCGSSAKPNANARSTPLLQIGQSATVRGPSPKQRVRVTLLSYRPSMSGTSDDHPEFDYQFAAAQLRIQNVGSSPYSGDPSGELTIVSTEAQTSKPASLTEGACDEIFARAVSIPPGVSAEGCVPAQVLVVATPATLRFEPFGKAAGSARWSLKRHRAK